MTANAAVRLFAGFMMTLSLVLLHTLGPWALALTGLIGVNLLIHGTTGFCLASKVFAKVGLQVACSAPGMNVDRGVSIGAGMVVLGGVGVGLGLASVWPVTFVVGAVAISMAQSAFSGWCPMMSIAQQAGLES